MRKYSGLTVAAALLIAGLEALAIAQAAGAAQAGRVAPCDMRLRVELTPDVPDPLDTGFVSSLLGNHPDYRLTLERQDPWDSSVIALDLTGPGPEESCREVVAAMRKDARITSLEVERDTADIGLTANTAQPLHRVPPAAAVQPMGTVHAGPDGDWEVKPLNGASYAQEARDRYECDIWAVAQTGFDPTEDDGGVPPDEVPNKRADYLRAEAACFESRGYLMR